MYTHIVHFRYYYDRLKLSFLSLFSKNIVKNEAFERSRGKNVPKASRLNSASTGETLLSDIDVKVKNNGGFSYGRYARTE